MRPRLLLVVVGAIAIAVAGCASEEAAKTSPSPSPEASAPSPSPSPGATGQPFAQPLVAQKPGTAQAVPGLIQPTNADERAKEVQARINAQQVKKDPFFGVPPVLQQPMIPQAGRSPQPTLTGQRVPPLPGAPQPALPPVTIATAPPRPSSPFPPGRTPAGPATPGVPARPVPPPPTANLANAVEVSGVVYVGGKAQAIVKAPNETTSRYVRVGQRLSDGQVLVKRIEINRGSDPIVVLEENGIEVPRAVGEGGAPSQQAGGQSA